MVSILLSESEKSIDRSTDQARKLIQTYRESEWRTTRLDVLRSLRRFDDPRSLQFLIEVAGKNEDLAEQQLAILSLSHRKSPVAKAYLRRTYRKSPDTLKAHLAYALGQVHDFESIPTLLSDLDQARAARDGLWLRNIILSLGELKAFAALPKLHKLLEEQGADQELSIAVLFALGRLDRSPERMQAFESKFADDSLQHQIYQSSLSQMQIRSQFKLEDYVHKIFNSTHPHPVLPLELRAFDSSEVQLTLELFPLEKHWRQHLFAIRGLAPEARVPVLEKILSLGLSTDELDELYTQAEFLVEEKNAAQISSLLEPPAEAGNSLRLKWLRLMAQVKDISSFGDTFLKEEDATAIQFVNLWSEWAVIHSASNAHLKWQPKSRAVFARLIRAYAELQISVPELNRKFAEEFKSQDLRPSLLLYVERVPRAFELEKVLPEFAALKSSEQEALGARISSALDAMLGTASRTGSAASQGIPEVEKQVADSISALIAPYLKHFNIELKTGALQVLRRLPIASLEKEVITLTRNQDPLVELNAVIALKSYPASREASEALAEKLESESPVIRGRALDSLCAHRSLAGKRAVMEYLKRNLDSEETVDKIYRSFSYDAKGSEEFVQALDRILKENPDHVQWEKLVALRERLNVGRPAASSMEVSPEALKELDARLVSVIPQFEKLDVITKSALRAAEQPLLQAGDLQNLPVDKAPTVLEYCKALDLVLERHLGQKHLFPKLDSQLHDFQTLWHRVGFSEDYPQVDKVINALGLKGKFAVEHFPLHKAKLMCATFFNGKILQDRFRVFDGLRAWSVIFLIFTRKIPLPSGAVGPMLKLSNLSDEKCISIAKKLMMLQDLRNPAAHRQTYTEFASVKTVRDEAISLLNVILEAL